MADNKQYIKHAQENGNVMISEYVLETIVAHAVGDVEGVASFSSKPGAEIADTIAKRNWGKGLKVTIGQEDEVYIDCNICIKYGQSVIAVGNAVQEAVISALDSMTGVKVVSVNVNVCGIIRK